MDERQNKMIDIVKSIIKRTGEISKNIQVGINIKNKK